MINIFQEWKSLSRHSLVEEEAVYFLEEGLYLTKIHNVISLEQRNFVFTLLCQLNIKSI